MDKKDLTLELIREVRDDQKEANEKADKHREETLKWHYEANARLDIYNEQLKVHIEGVDTLKQLHLDNVERIKAQDERINTLEEPSKSLNYIKKTVLWIAGLTGGIVTIVKAFNLL